MFSLLSSSRLSSHRRPPPPPGRAPSRLHSPSSRCCRPGLSLSFLRDEQEAQAAAACAAAALAFPSSAPKRKGACRCRIPPLLSARGPQVVVALNRQSSCRCCAPPVPPCRRSSGGARVATALHERTPSLVYATHPFLLRQPEQGVDTGDLTVPGIPSLLSPAPVQFTFGGFGSAR